MDLRAKFNLVLVCLFVVGTAVTAFIFYELVQKNARDEVLQNAGVMMASAMAVRSYTVEQIKPHLEANIAKKFPPQIVPAYAATEVFTQLRKIYPDYSYKEATLNPTNPRDRASDWEADIVNKLRSATETNEVVGVRATPSGSALYMARPIKITQAACLDCHSTPSAAPHSLIDQYGSANGFGWKLNEIIGAQIVSIPMEVAINKANEVFFTFLGALVGLLVVFFLALNWMLSRIVIKPVTRMSHVADQISTGNMQIPEFAPKGSDEICLLAKSFNRMRRSLHEAMKMIES